MLQKRRISPCLKYNIRLIHENASRTSVFYPFWISNSFLKYSHFESSLSCENTRIHASNPQMRSNVISMSDNPIGFSPSLNTVVTSAANPHSPTMARKMNITARFTVVPFRFHYYIFFMSLICNNFVGKQTNRRNFY